MESPHASNAYPHRERKEIFDQPPRFDRREKKQFFSLLKDLMDTIAKLRTPSSRTGFFLMCGYFKVAQRFYLPQDFPDQDITFTAHQLNLDDEAFIPDEYAETTHLRHQKRILEIYGFMPFDEKYEATLLAKITTLARMHLKPRLMFDHCVDILMNSSLPNHPVPPQGPAPVWVSAGL